jgi:HSP20 family protein
MGDLFERASNAGQWAQSRAFPAVNIWEEGDQVFAEAELPGVKSEDVDVSATGNEVTLRGRRAAHTIDNTPYHRRERTFGEFSRVLQLPFEVDASAVEATLRDGVLLLKLPKAASARPRKIPVQTGETK